MRLDATMALPRSLRAPALARDFVRFRWPELGSDVLENVTLCVSELVTNALDHAVPPYELRLDRSTRCVRVEVEDSSHGKPEVQPLSPSSVRGRGMFIVSRVATAWGVDANGHGKTVWAEFDIDR